MRTDNFDLKGHFKMAEDVFGCHDCGGGKEERWEPTSSLSRPRGAAKHPTRHRTARHPAQNVNQAEARKLD